MNISEFITHAKKWKKLNKSAKANLIAKYVNLIFHIIIIFSYDLILLQTSLIDW